MSKVLVVVDSSQIEARVLPWLSGHGDLLETFVQNDAARARGEKPDFYAAVGSSYFGKPLTKEDPERQIAKSMVLGLGYGMGWFKFSMFLTQSKVQFTAADVERYGVNVEAFAARRTGKQVNRDRVAEMPSRLSFEDRLVHCAVTDYFVRLYRQKNAPITQCWKAFDEVLEAMLDDNADAPFGPNECLRVVRHGIVLPSGLTMKYPGLDHSGDGFSYMGGRAGKERVRAYGGSMTENVVQALARCIVAEQVLRVCHEFKLSWGGLQGGGTVATTTHDEGVFVVDKVIGKNVLAFALEAFRTAPAWAAGLPLNAAGGMGTSYGATK